jgi:hypothetical protein
MKPNRVLTLIPQLAATLATAGFLTVSAHAQGFDAGSNGSLGDVVITNDVQIPLPPDGKLHFKSLTVVSNAYVSFTRNANNTPVYILSQGDVLLSGRLDVSGGNPFIGGPGLGGNGGFDGGRPGIGEMPPGDGRGPGAGKAGSGGGGAGSESSPGIGVFLTRAVSVNATTNSGYPYGNAALIPLIGGSGGGGAYTGGGGGGGGAILVASNTKIEFGASFGNISATGGQWIGGYWNHGSGGAVKLVAPTIDGPTRIEVQTRGRGIEAGAGRVRMDAINYPANLGQVYPQQSLSFGSMLATGLEGTAPRLAVISLAGRDTTTNSTPVILPNGSAPEQPVVIQAANFGTKVPISIVINPDNGPEVIVESEIDNTGANPATRTISIPIPANTPIKLNVWTR